MAGGLVASPARRPLRRTRCAPHDSCGARGPDGGLWSPRSTRSRRQAQADATYGKLQAVMRTGTGEPSRAAGATHRLHARAEMNAYLQYRAQSWLPTGLTDPRRRLRRRQQGRHHSSSPISTACGSKSSGGWFDPTSYLSGRLPVHVDRHADHRSRAAAASTLEHGHRRRHSGAARCSSTSCWPTTRARPSNPAACVSTSRSSCRRRSNASTSRTGQATSIQ